jgi:uncharacterized protein
MQSESQKNLDLVKNLYGSIPSEGLGKVRSVLDPAVEWIEPDNPGLWFKGTHRGADNVMKEIMEPTPGKIPDFRIEISQLFPIGNHVIAIGRFHGRVKTTGKELNASTAHVWTFRNGKVVRFQGFHDEAQLLDALGVTARESQRMAA